MALAAVAAGLLPGAVAVRPEVRTFTEDASFAKQAQEPEPEAEPESEGAGFFTYCRETFNGEDAKQHMVLGTKDNMDSQLVDLGLDFTGLWWMRNNPVSEVLISFAGARANGASYPAVMEVPHTLPGHWSWRTNFGGISLMQFYSMSVSALSYMPFDMQSKDAGFIDTNPTTNAAVQIDEWGFYRVNDDEWNRTTTYQNGSPWKWIDGDRSYILTRILNEDGSPTKFWAEYLDNIDGGSKQQMFAPSCRRWLAILNWQGSHRVLSLYGTLLLLLILCCL